MNEEDSPPTVEVQIRPGSVRFDTQDDGWLLQEGDLYAQLSANVGSLGHTHPTGSDAKGVGEAVLLALTSAQALKSMTDCFRTWLIRDRTRRIHVAWTIGGSTEHVTVEASRLDTDTFERLESLLRRRIGD